MASTFKVAPQNYLGISWNRYRSDLYALALAKPSVYAKIRQTVLDKVKNDAINDMYETLFNVLNEGRVGTSEFLIRDGTNPALKPSYPEQKINEFCLSACKTLEQIVDDAIEILLPLDINKIIGSRYAEVGRLSGDSTEPTPAT